MEKIKNDLTGMRFGKWYVESFSHKKKYDKYYNCVCDCGNRKTILGNNLKRGLTTNCGCEKSKKNHDRCFIDLTGNKYNHLTCIRWENKNDCIYWLCKCDCGNETWVKPNNLKNNSVKSCGCIRANVNKIHGMSHTRIHNIWSKMIERCFDSNSKMYKWYGKRGISVCGEWKGTDGFLSFMKWSLENGYSENLTIDRIDNNGNYCPENCRWTDKITQANNTRANKKIEYNGEIHTIAEWSRIVEIPYYTIEQRILKLNWNIGEALGYEKHKRKGVPRNERGQFIST